MKQPRALRDLPVKSAAKVKAGKLVANDNITLLRARPVLLGTWRPALAGPIRLTRRCWGAAAIRRSPQFSPRERAVTSPATNRHETSLVGSGGPTMKPTAPRDLPRSRRPR